MKSGISANLLSHIAQPTSSLTACMSITRTDTTVIRFTSHNRDVVRSEGTYQSAAGVITTAVKVDAALTVPNMEAMGHLASAGLNAGDIRNGLYDHAMVEVFLCNWADPDSGKIQLPGAYVGRISLKDQREFEIEIRGLMQALQNRIGRTIDAQCRHELFDSMCGLTKATHKTSALSVAAVVNNRKFTVATASKPANYFTAGEVEWKTGVNTGRRMEVAVYTVDTPNDTWELFHPMPETISPADTFDAFAGCNKTRDDCRNKFVAEVANGNVENYGGSPDAPGPDEALKFGGQ